MKRFIGLDKLSLLLVSIAIFSLMSCRTMPVYSAAETDGSHYENNQVSVKAKILKIGINLFRSKDSFIRSLRAGLYPDPPAPPPPSLMLIANVRTEQLNGRDVWIVSPKAGETDQLILFLHGGAYVSNIKVYHWNFIEELYKAYPAVYVVPDYPLAPDADVEATYGFVDHLYESILADFPNKSLVFMGDSAGGGLALGFTQQLRDQGRILPEQLILFSPWVDLTMSHPEIMALEERDPMLSPGGLLLAAEAYAGGRDLKDPRISPEYGNFSDMVPIALFTGTEDILYADIRELYLLLEKEDLSVFYREYPLMFHDWILAVGLKESRRALGEVVALLENGGLLSRESVQLE